MKVATTMKIIVTTTMDMVLHNGYVRLLVEVVDGDGDVNKGEVGYCCLSLVMVCHLLMFVFFLFVVCLCLAFVVVFRLPLFVVRCCLFHCVFGLRPLVGQATQGHRAIALVSVPYVLHGTRSFSSPT